MTKIIGIISIKGGAGKTTSVVNLASTLAKTYSKRVLVVDTNLSAPNLRLHLGLEEPKIGIHEVLREEVEICDAIYNTNYGFHILPAKLNNKKSTKVSSLKEHLDSLKENYDFILLDSSPNMNAEILTTIDSFDYLLMIVNPDYLNLSCTLQAINIAKEKKIKILGLIVNKVYGSKNEISFKDIEKITRQKILAIIPYHLDIHEATLKRRPIELENRKEYYKEYSELSKFMILLNNPSEKIKLKNSFIKTIAQKNRSRIIKDMKR